MLVILIPSSLPKKRSGATGDTKAVASFLSEEVAAIAEKRPRKASEGGSFLLWSTKVDSPEAHAALKYLKPHQGDGRRRKQPLLLVVYPAQVIDGRGQPQILPKIVAQHHCTPPPSPRRWLRGLTRCENVMPSSMVVCNCRQRKRSILRRGKKGIIKA